MLNAIKNVQRRANLFGLFMYSYLEFCQMLNVYQLLMDFRQLCLHLTAQKCQQPHLPFSVKFVTDLWRHQYKIGTQNANILYVSVPVSMLVV